MNIALAKRDLLDSLKADPEYRHAWNLENVYTGVCFQLRALREQRAWSQAELGKAAKMAPERICILEDPNADTKPTLNTLLRIANACDVGLDVRFVPYGTVIDRSTKTGQKTLEVASFDQELPELENAIQSALIRRLHGGAGVLQGPFGPGMVIPVSQSANPDALLNYAFREGFANPGASQAQSFVPIAGFDIANQAGLPVVPAKIAPPLANEGRSGHRITTRRGNVYGRRHKDRIEGARRAAVAASGGAARIGEFPERPAA